MTVCSSIVAQDFTNQIAFIQRIEAHNLLCYHVFHSVVIRGLAQMTVHFTRSATRSAFGFHPGADRGHPWRSARQSSAGRVNLTRFFIIVALPVDVAEMLI